MILEYIKKELLAHRKKSDIIKIWYIKEYLQIFILEQIYENDTWKDLVFYWWTATRFLFWLNRLSEDLDFVGVNFEKFDLLWKYLVNFFKTQNILVNYKIQKFRIILNFKNFLSKFNLKYQNSKDLYIKIEISSNIQFCKNYDTKLYPIFKLNRSLIIKSFDKQTLFSTKINAVLYRKWQKETPSWRITVKWRDIYDLFWYLSNNFKPNIDCIDWINDIKILKNKLINIIENINFREVVLDIENFIEDKKLLNFFEKDWKNFLIEKIKEL